MTITLALLLLTLVLQSLTLGRGVVARAEVRS